MHFDKVGFIGLGLIGGSIARKMKENNPKVSIIATAGHQQTIEDAFGLGLIDNNELLELNSFKDCDVIFLCAPVNKNIEYLTQLKDIIKDDCIITDVGSTKTQIHEKVIELGLERNFIGGHPMTGSEKTGILNSDKQLLENVVSAALLNTLKPIAFREEVSTFAISSSEQPINNVPKIAPSITVLFFIK